MDAPHSATRFDGLATAYAAHRPAYPVAIVEFLREELALAPPARIVDVGSGTGISAELFLQAGYDVTCVEPSPEMAAKAREKLAQYPRAHIVQRTAESTGLPDASATLVLAAHSFHWFDVAACRQEFARILRPRGWVALLWNSRDDSDAFTREYYALIEPYASPHPHLDLRSNEARAQSLFGNDYRARCFPNPTLWTLEQLLGFVFSASYLPNRGTAAGARLAAEVGRLFERHAVAGSISFAFTSQLFYCTLRTT